MLLGRWLLVSASLTWGCSGEFGGLGALGPDAEAEPDEESDEGGVRPTDEDPPPAVRIDTPVRGAFVDADTTPHVEVTGRVIAGRPTAVRVDGEPAELAPDGGFKFVDDHPAVGVRHYTVEAEDAAGRVGSSGLSVLYGTLAPADERVPDALSVHVGPAVLADVALSVEELVAGIDLEGLAMDQNPVAQDWWGTLTVEGLTRGRVAIALEPTNAGLAIDVRVADIDVDLHNDAPGPWNQDGWARADDTVLSGVVDLWASQDGRIEAALVEETVDLEGFEFDVSGIEGESLVRGLVEDMLRGQIEGIVRDRVPPLLEDTLSSLELTRAFAVAGAALTLDARFESVDVDARGLSLRAAASLRADASAAVPPGPGTLRTPSEAPQIGADRLVASVADDLVDQVLSAAWSAGLLDREVALTSPGSGEPLTLSFLSLVVPALAGLAPDDAPVIATTDPLLPPIVRFDEAGATLSIGELHVVLEAETAAGRVPLVRLALAVDADLEAAIAGGEATLSLRDVRFVADPVEAPASFPEGQPLQELLQGIVDLMAPEIAGTIASFALPAIQHLRLTECDLGEDGPAGDFLTIACDTAHE